MKIVSILTDYGRTGFASHEDVENGCDVPLRTEDGVPTGVNVKADSIVVVTHFTELPSEEK